MKKILAFIIFINILYAQNLDIKTFGTLGGVHNDNGNYTFRKDTLHKKGSSNNVDFNTDSLLGLQVSKILDEKNTLIAQGILKQDYNGEKKFDLDWIYLKYFSNDNYFFKIGRIRTPYYKNSDNLNIGYSNLMVREPIEVYGQVPFSAYNGIEFSYSNLINDYLYSFQINYGREVFTAPIHSINEEIEITMDNFYGITFSFDLNYIQFRTTHLNADVSAENSTIDTLFENLRTNGLNNLANTYELKNKNSTYSSFGIFSEYNNFILNSEYGQRKVSSFYVDMKGYYITLAYSLDKFIPYATYAKSTMIQELNINSGVNDLDNLLAIQNLSQKTSTIGVKYFLNENIDFKLQYDYIVPNGDNSSFYVSETTKPSNLNVISFTLDFIF